MKKLVFLVCIAIIYSFTDSRLMAQKKHITVKAASLSKEYTVINPEEAIVLYKYMHKAHSAKEVDKYSPKYFFTTKSSDVLIPLTKDNLKKAYPANHAFHDAIDAGFNKDEELINYDGFHKMYKINRLLLNDGK